MAWGLASGKEPPSYSICILMIEEVCVFGFKGKWEGSGRSLRRRNSNQNIFYENKSVSNYKKKGLIDSESNTGNLDPYKNYLKPKIKIHRLSQEDAAEYFNNNEN